jgi:transcriptional regulator with XRE-family HTH domain
MESNAIANPGAREYFADFAAALRYWRSKRGFSQLQLASLSTVSQRHLSFLENGRAQPSRELIIRLGLSLDIPLRQRNVMLLAAGFAPAYQERKLADPELAAVRHALEFMLAQQAPFPALVVDRLWNLHMCNEPASVMIKWLLGMPETQAVPLDGAINLPGLVLDPNGLRPYLENWDDVAADMLVWIQREAMSDGPGSEAGKLLADLQVLAGIELSCHGANLERHVLPCMPLKIRKDGVELNMFTVIATLGTPRDVTLHELRIESFFAADATTAAWFQDRVK